MITPRSFPRALLGLAAGLVVLVAPVQAQMRLDTNSDSVWLTLEDDGEGDRINGFSFTDLMRDRGLTQAVTDVTLSVESAGALTFSFLAEESRDQNYFAFDTGPRPNMTPARGVRINENNGAIRTVNVAAGTSFTGDDIFFGGNRTRGTFGTDSPFVASFFGSSGSDTTGLTQLVFGFNDRAGGGDSDFDDFLLQVNFAPATVPEPPLLALMAVGLLGVAAGRRLLR
ncbi:hypothetical protein [Yunchengibacter salinarum]|uniref:hypothetical protein n=1 Tax=Yunchengibacter salinarum TaxID=3133399 RepID=UPI0035B58A90